MWERGWGCRHLTLLIAYEEGLSSLSTVLRIWNCGIVTWYSVFVQVLEAPEVNLNVRIEQGPSSTALHFKVMREGARPRSLFLFGDEQRLPVLPSLAKVSRDAPVNPAFIRNNAQNPRSRPSLALSINTWISSLPARQCFQGYEICGCEI